MKRQLIALIFVVVAHCGKGQSLGFSIANGQKSVQIPFELSNNLIIVPLILNNTLPLKFILDTGVRTTILTEKSFSDLLHLAYTRKYTIAGPGGEKSVDAYITNNVSLDLPGIHGQGHAMLVLAEDYLQLRNYLGTEVHGILGYELFSRFVIKIDYERKILTIMSPSKFKPGRKYEKIPIRIEDTKPYVVGEVTQVDGTELTAKLLIDTGASHALMLESTSDKRINSPSNYISSTIGRGLGGIITGKIGRIKSVTVGNFELSNPVASFPDPNSYIDSLKFGNVSRNGSLGGEFLSRFTVVFDFPNEKIYLKKNSQFKKPFHYNLSGLTVKASGLSLNVFEIVEVRKESSASQADIVAGDIILKINGLLTNKLKLEDINGMFNAKAGKSISLEILRDGEKLKREFKLRDQI